MNFTQKADNSSHPGNNSIYFHPFTSLWLYKFMRRFFKCSPQDVLLPFFSWIFTFTEDLHVEALGFSALKLFLKIKVDESKARPSETVDLGCFCPFPMLHHLFSHWIKHRHDDDFFTSFFMSRQVELNVSSIILNLSGPDICFFLPFLHFMNIQREMENFVLRKEHGQA